MKRLIEEENEGMVSLLNEKITVFTSGYFYTGKLVGVNDTCLKLEDPSIIYETGKFSDSEWKDAQSMCVEYFYIAIPAIEAFGIMK